MISETLPLRQEGGGVLNSPLQTDWHEFRFAPPPQNLATPRDARYKRPQFQFASHLAQSVGPGASCWALVRGPSVTPPLLLSLH